jgi:hypothetical protein
VEEIEAMIILIQRMTCRTLLGLLLCLGVPVPTSALTFQFDQNQPGVRGVITSYIHFPVQGQDVTTVLPATFSIVTYRSEADSIIMAKTGDIRKNKSILSLLQNVVGKDPQKTKGPHDVLILSKSKPEKNRLSAYATWGQWLLIGKSREALADLLKRFSTPESAVTPPALFQSDGLRQQSAIQFWGENGKGELTALLKEGQAKVLIPVIRDPSQIARFSGTVQVSTQQKLAITATVVPSSPQSLGTIKNDLKFMLESMRRKVGALSVPYQGEVLEAKGKIQVRLMVGDYRKAKSGLLRNPK